MTLIPYEGHALVLYAGSARFFDNSNAALLWAQMRFLSMPSKGSTPRFKSDADGWFKATVKELCEHLLWGPDELTAARAKLQARGLLESSRRGIPAALWWRMDHEAYLAAYVAWESDMGNSPNRIPEPLKIREFPASGVGKFPDHSSLTDLLKNKNQKEIPSEAEGTNSLGELNQAGEEPSQVGESFPSPAKEPESLPDLRATPSENKLETTRARAEQALLVPLPPVTAAGILAGEHDATPLSLTGPGHTRAHEIAAVILAEWATLWGHRAVTLTKPRRIAWSSMAKDKIPASKILKAVLGMGWADWTGWDTKHELRLVEDHLEEFAELYELGQQTKAPRLRGAAAKRSQSTPAASGAPSPAPTAVEPAETPKIDPARPFVPGLEDPKTARLWEILPCDPQDPDWWARREIQGQRRALFNEIYYTVEVARLHNSDVHTRCNDTSNGYNERADVPPSAAVLIEHIKWMKDLIASSPRYKPGKPRQLRAQKVKAST